MSYSFPAPIQFTALTHLHESLNCVSALIDLLHGFNDLDWFAAMNCFAKLIHCTDLLG